MIEKLKSFFTKSNNISRDAYIWNTVGSVLYSFQSVVLLMALTRTVGLVQAGIFTIAYANANLFLNIGKYGMRYFQASDVQEQYSYKEYICSRIITTIIMVIMTTIYTCDSAITYDYPKEKTWIIIWMCFYKAADAIEDIFEGNYQQKGRLDIAAKILAVRMGFTILVYVVGLALLRKQLYALVIATVVTYVLMFLFMYCASMSSICGRENGQVKQVMHLLWSCFPLCMGSFLAFYIGSAPKYAIDAQLSDELQAYYAFVAMPVFVIEMLNGFIFNPVLRKMALYWRKKEVDFFLRRIFMQIGIIVLITVICIIGAYFWGIPVLSWMYNADLAAYKNELLVLLIGGGFLGISGFLNTMITVIRFQKSVVWGYGCIALIAFFLSSPIVQKNGIMGAAKLYTFLMGGLSFCFCVLLVWGVWKKK